MRAKLRSLIFVGLSTGVFAAPLCAEPKPSILESMKLPSLFGKKETPTTTAAPTNRAPGVSNSSTFAKPGNARGDIKPKAATSGTNSGNFLPSFNDVFGTGEKPIGLPAEGIEAPPPPTLEPSAPKAATKNPHLPNSTANKQPAPPTKTPSINLGPPPAPALEAKLPSPIVKKTAPIPTTSAATKKSDPKTSSRRGWQAEEPTYTALHDGHATEAVTTESEMMPTGLIDRRPLLDADTSAGIETPDEANQSSLRPPNANFADNPPEPVVFGQEPLEGRDRLSTAARLGGTAVRNSLGDAGQPSAEAAPVQAASYNLPPILTPEEARKLRANRGK